MIRRTRCAALVLALVLVATVAASAAGSNSRATRSLTDARVGTSKTELLAQITFSSHVVHFFTIGKGRWMTEPRHDTCLSVIGLKRGPLCLKARDTLLAHLWLRGVAKSKYALLYNPSLPWAFWRCVSSGEGAPTTNTGNGFFGMYQMDWGFMRNHGADMLAKYHGLPASSWSVEDQTIVAERGYQVQGPGAWPNTAPQCVYLRSATAV